VRCGVVDAGFRRKTFAHDLGVAVLAYENIEYVAVDSGRVQTIDAVFGTPGWDRSEGETEDTRQGIEEAQRFHFAGRK
jgi:hypothetical protein